MERPVAGARIGGGFEPAAGRQDVGPAILIDIAHADPVAVAPVADDVRDECAIPDLVPRLRRTVLLRDHLVRLAVVVHIGEDGELDVEARMNLRLLPR